MAKRKLGRGLELLIGKGGGDVPTRTGRDKKKPAKKKASKKKSPRKRVVARETVEQSELELQARSAGDSAEQGPVVLMVSPDEIRENPQQPRKDFPLTELEALKTSVARDGLLQPLLARIDGKGYQLVAGERRLRASRELGMDKVPIILADVADEKLLELALVENLHRDDLNPIELGEAYRSLLAIKSCTQEQLAEQLGLSRSAVSNTIRLLDLPDDIKKALVRGQISAGHAKVLLSATNKADQRLLFERIAEENMSVRETEAFLKNGGGDLDDEPAGKADRKGRAKADKDPNILKLEEEMMEALGAKVSIRVNGRRKQKGVLSVSFNSREEFDRLRERLLGLIEA